MADKIKPASFTQLLKALGGRPRHQEAETHPKGAWDKQQEVISTIQMLLWLGSWIKGLEHSTARWTGEAKSVGKCFRVQGWSCLRSECCFRIGACIFCPCNKLSVYKTKRNLLHWSEATTLRRLVNAFPMKLCSLAGRLLPGASSKWSFLLTAACPFLHWGCLFYSHTLYCPNLSVMVLFFFFPLVFVFPTV